MKVSADVVYEGVKKGLNVTDEQLTNIIYKRIKLKSGKTKNRVWEDEENGRTYQFFRVDHEIYSKIVDGEDYSKYALMYDYDSYSTMKSENDWIFNCCIKGTKEDIIDMIKIKDKKIKSLQEILNSYENNDKNKSNDEIDLINVPVFTVMTTSHNV